MQQIVAGVPRSAWQGTRRSAQRSTWYEHRDPIDTQGNELTFATIEPNAGLQGGARHEPRRHRRHWSRDSRLKGRGGAGFPTGMKWGFAAAEKAEPKYIICNADEGEPGTFKDRVILTDFADLVFEGMTIGARAMGAEHRASCTCAASTRTCARTSTA